MSNIEKLAREYQSTWVGLRDAHSRYQTTMERLEQYRGSRGYEADANKAKETYDNAVDGIHYAQGPKLRAILKSMEATIPPKKMDVPSEEAVRLLQALSMREHLDADEVALATETLKDSPTAMKSLAEMEVAQMKVSADDTCKLQLKDADKKSQRIIEEATQKSNELLSNANRQSQEMIDNAAKKSEDMINEATERTEKIALLAEARANAAKDIYDTMVVKVYAQSKDLKKLLESQLSLYNNFNMDIMVDETLQSKLNDVHLESNKEIEPDKDEGNLLETESNVVESSLEVKSVEPSDEEVKVVESSDEEIKPSESSDTALEEDMVYPEDTVQEDVIEKQEEPVNQNEENFVDNNESVGISKKILGRVHTQSPMVFNRNGVPHKDLDLRNGLVGLESNN